MENSCYINKPLVSVIVPTYKRDIFFVSRSVTSLINQTYKNIEIIVIDDSPNDYEKRDEVKKYMDSIDDKRVQYYQNEKNLGGSLARNRGISLAKGSYISFLDDDDEYLPHKIEKQIKFMQENDSDLSFSDMIMYDKGDKVVDFREYTDIASFDNNNAVHNNMVSKL